MSYMDGPGPRRLHRPLRRQPLNNPPAVADTVRALILDAADRYPRFTAAELAALLQTDGVDVEIPAVRGVLEASA